MSMKPYPEYKDSGLEWLGSLPASWKALRLKIGFDLQKRPISSDMEIVTAFRDGQVTLRKNRRVDGYTEGDKQIGYQGIEPGDLVIHAMDAFAGAIGVSDSRGKSTPVYNVCKPKRDVEARFFAFALRHLALTGYIESLSKGIRERSTDFRWADAKNVIVPFPPQNEQYQIVEFLDRETAEIDAFIADQEELIELLSERRTATITRAVTKGLDPNAPMKDGGVSWLGYIPSHWEVRKLKSFVSVPITDGPHETPEILDAGIPFISAEAVSSGSINFEKARGFISKENNARFSKKYSPRRDDIYMVKSGATTGICAIVETDDIFNIWSPLASIRCDDKTHPRFVLHALRSMNFQESVRLFWNYGTQQNIGMQVLSNLVIPYPKISEQRLISDYLDTECAEIDAAIADSRAAIALSKERRAAVISAAVTGKIDVRGLIDPAASGAEGASVGAA